MKKHILKATSLSDDEMKSIQVDIPQIPDGITIKCPNGDKHTCDLSGSGTYEQISDSSGIIGMICKGAVVCCNGFVKKEGTCVPDSGSGSGT